MFGRRGLLRKTKNHLNGIFEGKYENEKFWNNFGKNYYEKYEKNKKEWVKEQEILLVDHLKEYEFDSVLEFGCGYGRLTKVLCENFSIKTYNAFDLVPEQIENAKKYCKDLDVQFKVSSINDFKSTEKFDLVVGPEILLHIEPNDIEFVIKKMSSFANKFFMATASPYNPDAIIHRGTHTFYHNYKKIYDIVGLPQPKIIPVNDINEIQFISL